ncbi:MAG: DUF6951 family protein [Desulfocucumaceae bacterium]
MEINSGICGFITRVEVRKAGDRMMEISIDSECPNIKKVAADLKTVMPLREIFCKLHETETYKMLQRGVVHPACLVPIGVLKGVEAEAGLALPRDGYIRLLT